MAEDCDKILKVTQTSVPENTEEVICDVRTERMIPDELREPKPTGEQGKSEQLLRPDGIPVYNHKQEAACEPGQIGEEVVVPERILTQMVFFSAVLSISDQALDYIARNRKESWVSERFHAGGLTPKELAEETKIKVAEAKELLEVLQGVQETLDENALARAKAALFCYYQNRKVTARCEDPNVLRPEDYAEAVYEVTVEEGRFTSLFSQEDADNRALSYAQSLLNCLYGNPEVIVTCVDRPGRPQEVMEPVPNDVKEVYPGKGLRVGTFVVNKNIFISPFSVEETIEQAKLWGYSQLVCWYPNDPVELECEDPDARNEFVDPKVDPPVDAELETETPGQHVFVPEGYFTSELSRERATADAKLFAETLLRCCFINDEYYVECLPETVTLQDGKDYEIFPERDEENFSVHVPRGRFTSCNSKEEANELARQYVEGILTCSYCNLRVLPTCVPDWIIEGVKNKKIALPLTGPVISDGEHSIPLNKLPPEATVGIEANKICLPDAQRAQSLGESMAVTPATPSSWCTCYSEEVIVGCAVEDPYGNGVPSGGRGFKSNGEPYNFFSLLEPGTNLFDTMSYPRPGSYIRFAAGLFSFNCYGMLDEGEAKENAAAAITKQVMDMAKSLIHCFIANPPAKGRCGSVEEGTLWGDEWIFGLGKEENDRLTAWSYSEDNYIEFPEGLITREIPLNNPGQYADLLREIYDQTEKMVKASIICAYYNEQKEGPCIPPNDYSWVVGDDRELPRLIATYTRKYRQANSAVVPAHTIIAETAEYADQVAQQLADAIGACDVDTTVSYRVEIPDYQIPDFPWVRSEPEPTPPPTIPEPTPEPIPTTPEPTPEPIPTIPEPTPEPIPTTPEPTPEPQPEPTPEPQPEPTPEPKPEPTPEPKPEPTPEPKPDPTPKPQPKPTEPGDHPFPNIPTSSSPPNGGPGPPGPGPGGGGYSSPEGGWPPGPRPGKHSSPARGSSKPYRFSSKPKGSGSSKPPKSCPPASGCDWKLCPYFWDEDCKSPLANAGATVLQRQYLSDKTREYKMVYTAQSRALSNKIKVLKEKITLLRTKLKQNETERKVPDTDSIRSDTE